MKDNTIFDDVFRTMIEKMTFLIVPLINEVFHTSYPMDVKITQLRNEYQLENGKIITDSRLLIEGRIYHIECQSTDDLTMAVRMVEYDFVTAVEFAHKQGRRYQLEFPHSFVLYLRSGRNTPEFLEIDMIFPNGQSYLYKIPTMKLENYTKDNIFEKNLLMLLPFYIMRYEKRAHEVSEDPELFQTLLNDYEVIRSKLEKEAAETGRSELYENLIGLITQISDYIFRNEEKVRKGISEMMRGHVLELESEKRERLLKEQGEERLSVLINRLILDGRSDEIQKVVTDKEIREKTYKEYQL